MNPKGSPSLSLTLNNEGWFFSNAKGSLGPFPSLSEIDTLEVARKLGVKPKEVLGLRLGVGARRRAPHVFKEKQRKEAKAKEDHPLCKDCLAYRTKFCDWSHVSFNPEKDRGLAGPVLQPTDGACIRFYPLEVRLKDDPRYHRLLGLQGRKIGIGTRARKSFERRIEEL